MKVKLAAQTFSNSVAIAIKFCDETMKLPEFSESDATVEFIIKINNLFDILNSWTLNAYGYKKPICERNAKDIMEYLTKIETYIKEIKLMGKSILETNRKVGFFGLLICIKSLKKIQDHLECFFSSIRAKGGFNNNPTAFQFQSAYRRLIVHGEIKSIESEYCIPLEEIKILTHTDVRYEKKIDKYANRRIVETEDPNLHQQDDDDHDYLPDPCRLVNVHLRDHSIHWWMCTLRKRVFKDHFNRHPFIGNHRILLIKAITAGYLEIRIHHATKTFEPKEKNRNVHNKLVLFKGK
uniref:SFRICE_037430 n=1 Tax=Spodoptera frugiperda TaxID=7108 RepID=A0A2H1VKR5_SPOFR